MTKKVNAEVLLTDILERIRSMEQSDKEISKSLKESNETLDIRLTKIEAEIEGVKKAAKVFSLVAKVITGLVAFIIMVWNFAGKYFVRKV